jgi:uncharacterized membrane protein YbaN (DUF454 family)
MDDPHDHHHVDLHPSPAMRALLWTAGSIALLLGLIGIVVPGLPTTPFVLVAAACYARASARFYWWLVHNPTLGPLIREWRLHRSIPWRIKRVAIATMVLTIGVSLWQLDHLPWLQLGLAATGLVGIAVVARIPSRDRPPKR